MYSYKTFILLIESKKNDKFIKKTFDKIIKWFPYPSILKEIIKLHPKLSVWIVNQLIDETLKASKIEKDLDINKKDLLTYSKKNEKFLFDNWKELKSGFNEIIDWVKSYGITKDEREQLPKMSYRTALEKSQSWHCSLKAGGEMTLSDDDDLILLKFDDGFYWVDLQTSYSQEEADCMGHCGNTNKGDTIYSLRKKIGKNKVECHITTAVDSENGIIYQMKGKNNTKPIKKYHKYIVDLLINKEIGLKGFGFEYLKNEDFSPSDLDKDLYDKLISVKPDIDRPVFNDEEIDSMFDRFLDGMYIESDRKVFDIFHLIKEYYNPDYDIVSYLNDKNDDLFDILFELYSKKLIKELIKELKKKSEFISDFNDYIDKFSTILPVDKFSTKYNIKIDPNASAVDNWTIIAKNIGLDELKNIADEYHIDNSKFSNLKYKDYYLIIKKEYTGTRFNKEIFDYDLMINDIFENDKDVYNFFEENFSENGNYVKYVQKVFDFNIIIGDLYSLDVETKLKILEEEFYYELNEQY